MLRAMYTRFLQVLMAVLALTIFPGTSHASFHLWKIKEVYSNADGSIQFIEMFDANSGENMTGGKQLSANSDGTVRTFTLTNLSSSATMNKHLLLATPGFAALPGAVTPDFVLPCGPFFDPSASSITISFAGVDSITFTGASLPTSGTNSLTDSNLGAGNAQSLSSGASSPTNFAGAAGAMALAGCLQTGSCEPCDDGVFCNGAETCSGSACTATPCDGICDEGAMTCIECDSPDDCDDDNPCTDDDCNGSNECENTGNASNSCSDGNPCTDDACNGSGNCVGTNNTDPCDDGLFCTTTDACSAGSCVGTGDACPGDQCLEGIDACGDCNQPSDCDDSDPCTDEACDGSGNCSNDPSADGTACTSDGDFCTGVEECQSGSCVSPGDPCSGLQTCDESGDVCESTAAGDDGGITTSDGGMTSGGANDASSPGGPHPGNLDGSTGNGSNSGDGSAGPGAGGPGSGTPDGGAVSTASAASDDAGCNCRLPRSSTSQPAAAPLLLLGLALLLRRSRR
jgi:MYXO-CTERM domain-containing protein